jgi:hypothetical protein
MKEWKKSCVRFIGITSINTYKTGQIMCYNSGHFDCSLSNPNFKNADQVLKYVILRRPTSKLLFRTQQSADEESHVSKGSVCFFAVLVQN